MGKHRNEHPDGRFKVAKREAWIGIFLVVFNFVWWYGFAYGLGSGDPHSYTFVLGMPSWFFYSCVVGFIVMVALVVAAVKFFFKEVPFDDEEEVDPK